MEQQNQDMSGMQSTQESSQKSFISSQVDSDELEDRQLLEQFLADPTHDYRNLQYGDTVDGVIMRIDRDEILVDIGSKSEGVVQSREMQSLTSEDRAALKPGDELLVFVVQSEDREGRAVLSVDKARQEKSWRRLQQGRKKKIKQLKGMKYIKK